MLKNAGPDKGQASRLAVAAVALALVFAAMAVVGPLLSGELRQPPPIVLLFQAR